MSAFPVSQHFIGLYTPKSRVYIVMCGADVNFDGSDRKISHCLEPHSKLRSRDNDFGRGILQDEAETVFWHIQGQRAESCTSFQNSQQGNVQRRTLRHKDWNDGWSARRRRDCKLLQPSREMVRVVVQLRVVKAYSSSSSILVIKSIALALRTRNKLVQERRAFDKRRRCIQNGQLNTPFAMYILG